MLLLLVAAASAACPADPLAEAIAQAARVEASYANMDDAGLASARAMLEEALPCLANELSPMDAVVLHRAKAIGAYVGGDEAGSRRSWLAVKALQPDWQPSADLMPPGHPMRKLWETPIDGGTPLVPQELAPAGGWSVDGTRQNMVPANRAYLLQGLSSTGAIVYTGYLYQASDVPSSLDVDLVPSRRVRAATSSKAGPIHVAGTATAGVLALGGVGALALSSKYGKDAGLTDDDVEATNLLTRSRNTAAAGYTLLGAAAVVGTVTWVVKW